MREANEWFIMTSSKVSELSRELAVEKKDSSSELVNI